MSLTVHGAIGFAQTTSASNPTVTNGAAQPIAANSVILLFALNSTTAGAVSASTVTGGGLTWQRLVTNLAFNSTDATVQHCTMEVWWATNPSLIAGSGITVTANYGSGVPSCLALISVEGANTSAPLDASGRFTNTNTSATVGVAPSVTVGTTAVNTAAFQFYGITGTASGNATQPAGWTLDPANGQASSPATFLEGVHRIFASAQANATSSWSGTDKRWGIMSFAIVQAAVADTVTIAQTLFAPTQAVAAKEVEKATIAQTLFAPTQAVAATERATAVITQTLFPPTQAIVAVERYPVTIAQTLFAPTQAATAVERYPVTIAQTLFAPTQAATAVERYPVTIAQTLFAPTQEADATETGMASIAQTLFVIVETADDIELEPAHIDQTLSGITQEADASTSSALDETAIDQVLFAPVQEVHVYTDVIVGQIAQTFRRRVGRVFAEIAQTFRRRLSVQPAPEPPPSNDQDRERHGGGGGSAPKDPRIHPGELELFREREYARGVAAAVPPPQIAVRQLTTPQFPTSRPSTVPFISRGKPK